MARKETYLGCFPWFLYYGVENASVVAVTGQAWLCLYQRIMVVAPQELAFLITENYTVALLSLLSVGFRV